MEMENTEELDARIGGFVDGSLLASGSFKESDNSGNSDAALYEKFILDDLDSYWDDINARLTVSRMVSNSVIKGMVNAVVDEAAEKLVSKEEEVAVLRYRLKCYEPNAANVYRLGPLTVMPQRPMTPVKQRQTAAEFHWNCLDLSLKSDYDEQLVRLRTSVDEQLERVTENLENLKSLSSIPCRDTQVKSNVEVLDIDRSVEALRKTVAAVFEQVSSIFSLLKASLFDSQCENELQKEYDAIVVQSYIKGLYDDFEAKLWEQGGLIDTLNKNRKKMVDELSAMREELEFVSRSLSSSEAGLLYSQNSHEAIEEWNALKRKDHVHWKLVGDHQSTNSEENGTMVFEKSPSPEKTMLEVADPPQLKGMTKEEAVTYYKNEITKMRRQHDSALQEKTEELFRLKREFLKERGSSHLRKDKDLDILRKKIPEVILKLDSILQEKVNVPVVHDNQLNVLKGQIARLYFQNKHLHGLLADKRRDISNLSSQFSNTANQMMLHSTMEANLLKQIEELGSDGVHMNMGVAIKDELFKMILKDFISQLMCNVEDFEIDIKIAQDVFLTIFRGVMDDTTSTIDPIIWKHQMENSSLEHLIIEKDEALCLVNKENEKLKLVIASLSASIKEKEQHELQAGLTLNQQKDRFDLVWQKLCLLKDKVEKQETLISEKTMELDSTKSRLDEALQQNDQYGMEIDNLKQKVKITSDALEEAEKQKNILHNTIEDKQKILSISVTAEEKQAKQMDSIAASVNELSTAVVGFENRILANISQNESRLKTLNHQWKSIVQKANLLRRKELWYKQMLELRWSNLQKAEAEVDLLGDEVDALLSLLGKIYIALDHYSPVLQYYPGVMETLKLVQRELKGDGIKLV